MKWASVITWIWDSIHSLAQSHIHNKTMFTEERYTFVALLFNLLNFIFDDSAVYSVFVSCVLQDVVQRKNYVPVSVSFNIKAFTADSLIKQFLVAI